MVETSVQKVVDKYKAFQTEEIVGVYEELSDFWVTISDILLRLQLVHSFSEYESEKELGESIQIHAIALALKDITQMFTSEVDKFETLHMKIFPYNCRGE